jgi:hypothetical protein
LVPSQSDRHRRRSTQSKADRERRARESAARRKARTRRRALIIAIIAMPLVAGGAFAGVLAGQSTSTPPSTAGSTIDVSTLLRLPAASALARGDGAAFVTDDLRNRLMRFDPSSGRVARSVHLAGRPVALLMVGTDLWVAEMVSNTVDEYAASDLHKIRSVVVPTGPSSLAFLNGQVWVTSVITNQVTPIGTTGLGPAGPSLPIPAGAVRIVAGFGSLWVTGTDDAVTEISPDNQGGGTVLPAIVTGQGPIGIAVGDGSVWVANATGATVVRIDPATRSVVHTYGVGRDPLTLAVAGGRVWLGDGSGQNLRTLYPAPWSAVLALGSTPRSILAVGGAVWVALANPGRVAAAQLN